ncbi:mannonate dehydratase [Staphylococcus sp. EZ-P03]|uniref:mannonate dehydratase n=1 Tax=Staphylococcus sp. EZ-P03 TaxID=2282739 RepID=UPI000DF7BC73|nr:mannonate dehydratase [Staphylococcus sp. EZ-P03]
MELSFRWYGESDPVTLENIKQIPDMRQIVTAIYDIPVGEVWSDEKIKELKKAIENKGLKFEVVESLPVSEEIKLGTNKRDEHIDNYKQSLRNLAKNGIKTVTYNFMPVFDWTRSQLDYQLDDGSNTLIYDHEKVKDIDPITTQMSLPGWDESYSREELSHLVETYRSMSEDELWENLKYFLDAVLPTAIEEDIDLAIHPDDPPWEIFGIPRIIKNEKSYKKLIEINDNSHNGICFCTGSLGSTAENNLPKMIEQFGDYIHFVHMRNVKRVGEKSFIETGHLTKNGSIDMKEIVKSLKKINFKGTIRPDHGRMIWGETGKAGYGLYDRALGATYINGLIEGVESID